MRITKKLTLGLGAASIATGLVLGGSLSASAVTATESREANGSAHADQERNGSYTDRDVVAFLVDGSGPIAEAHPDVAYGLGFTRGSAGLDSGAIDELTHALVANTPDFDTSVTEAITSGDPYRVESGLYTMEAALNQVATVVNSGEAVGYCAVAPVVAIDVLLFVANAAAIENGALWRNDAFWLPSAGASKFSVQDQSALIASNI